MENQTKTNLKKTTSGFSLTELIVMIVLIGIFAAMAMTRTSTGMTTIQVQIAIDQITSDIDYSKSMAFAKHDTITLVFSTTLEQYTIYTGPDGSRSVITDFPKELLYKNKISAQLLQLTEANFLAFGALMMVRSYFGKRKSSSINIAGGFGLVSTLPSPFLPFYGDYIFLLKRQLPIDRPWRLLCYNMV